MLRLIELHLGLDVIELVQSDCLVSKTITALCPGRRYQRRSVDPQRDRNDLVALTDGMVPRPELSSPTS
jgi:hypothetical protein